MCPAFVPFSSYLPRLLYQLISTKLSFIFTPMSNQRNTKHKRATGPMIVGEVDSAQVVTPKTLYKTKKDGMVMSTQIWKSLDPPSSSHVTPAIEKMKERETLNHEPAEFPSPPPEGSHTSPVGIQSLNPFSLLNIRRPDTT